MEGPSQEQLKPCLVLLAQKILNFKPHDELDLIQMLMNDLEMHTDHIHEAEDVMNVIRKYYRQQRSQSINEKAPIFRQYPYDLFIHAMIFVLDLALVSNPPKYIEHILSLPQHEQQTLQPFVHKVTLRDNFISPLSEHQQAHIGQEQHLLDITEQNQRNKIDKEHWKNMYQECKESYEGLKGKYEMLQEEIVYLKQERYAAIHQLGGSECGTVEQAVQKVKKDAFAFEKQIETLQKELQQKRVSHKALSEDLYKLQSSIKNNKYEEKLFQLQSILAKASYLQSELLEVQSRQQQLKATIDTLQIDLMTKKQQITRLQQQVSKFENDGKKYQSIRKLHSQFKIKMGLSRQNPLQ